MPFPAPPFRSDLNDWVMPNPPPSRFLRPCPKLLNVSIGAYHPISSDLTVRGEERNLRFYWDVVDFFCDWLVQELDSVEGLVLLVLVAVGVWFMFFFVRHRYARL